MKPKQQSRPIGRAALTNVFAPQALRFGRRNVDVGDQWARVLAITNFPPKVGPAWLAKAANLPGVVLAMHGDPTDPTALTMSLNRQISLLAGNLQTAKNELAIQRAEAQLRGAQALMRQIDQEQQSIFTTGVCLIVTAPDEATGLRRTKRVEGILAAAGMRARTLAFRQEEGFRAAGPWGIFPKELRGGAPFQIPSETLAAAFPFSSGGVNHGHGTVWGHDADGGLVLIDRWDPPAHMGVTNKNFSILSPPGSGKSQATKISAIREWCQGAQVIIIDPEREYRHMCNVLGGAWMNTAGGNTRINPLQAPALPPDVGDEDDDQPAGVVTAIQTHIQRVQGFVRTYLPGLTAMQQALLDQAIEEAYAGAGIGITLQTDPAAIPAEGWPHMGHVHAAAKRHADDEPGTEWPTVAALLRGAGEGIQSGLWAGSSTMPNIQDASFVVLDIHDLQDAPENVRRAQYLNVLGYAWDLVRADRTRKKILIVDEAWMLIDPNAPEALKFMKSLSKRIRKYMGSFMVVTQNVVDFLAPAIRGDGEQVLTNAAYTLLLRQGGRDLIELTNLFDLSEAEQDRLSNARVGEGLLIAGNSRVWLTIDTAPHETRIMYG